MGLVLPISSMAALLAILPKIASWASITCHCRIMPSLDGNSVLIDTRLQLFLELQNTKLTEIRGSLSNRVTGRAPHDRSARRDAVRGPARRPASPGRRVPRAAAPAVSAALTPSTARIAALY